MTKDEAMKLAIKALKWHKEHLMGVSPDKNTTPIRLKPKIYRKESV